MSYSVKFYLDNAISEKNINEILSSDDREAKKKLKEIFEEKQLQIFLYLRFSGRTIKVYTERKCTQKQWDKTGVNPRFYKAGPIELNNYLNKVKTKTAVLHEKNMDQKRITTKEQIMDIIDECNSKEVMPKFVTLEKAFEEFIAVKKQKHAANTIKKYNTTLKHLREFSAHSKMRLNFDNINAQFEVKWRDYFLNELGMTNNSIAKYIKTLKTFMIFCTEDREYNSKLNIYFRKFDSREKEKEVYALTVDELMKMYNYKFKDSRHAKVRDVFCFLCFTGLRFSDAEKLKREDIKNDGLHLLIKKTQTHQIIPLNDFAKKILEKYKDSPSPLPVISNQKTNDYLYEMGKKLKMNQKVKITQFKGAEVIEKYVPKYDILTTHLGRKTFVTNSLILGMNERTVKEISGHKNEANFRRYVAFADSYKNKVMNDVWNKENISKARIKPNLADRGKKNRVGKP